MTEADLKRIEVERHLSGEEMPDHSELCKSPQIDVDMHGPSLAYRTLLVDWDSAMDLARLIIGTRFPQIDSLVACHSQIRPMDQNWPHHAEIAVIYKRLQ